MNTISVCKGYGHIYKNDIDDIIKDVKVVLINKQSAPLARYVLNPKIWDKRDSISYIASANKVMFDGIKPQIEYECIPAPTD